MSPALRGEHKGWGALNELPNEYRQSAADASRHRRGSPRILLCDATGIGVFELRRLRPALAHTLNDDRRDAETFSDPGHVPGARSQYPRKGFADR